MRFSLFLTLSLALAAHDLYLRPRHFTVAAGQSGVVEFHNGDAFPNSQVPPVLARLKDANIVTPAGSQPLTGLKIADPMAVASFTAPAKGAFLLTARTTPNFIELEAKKFEEYLAHESLQHALDWRAKNGESAKNGRELYSKYVKSILRVSPEPDPFVTRPLGLPIEFVPAVDPASLKPGQPLTIQILLRGKPAPGLHVEASSLSTAGAVNQRQLGRTDAQGRIRVPLDVPGLWKLHAIHIERRADTKPADWESLWASLPFELRP